MIGSKVIIEEGAVVEDSIVMQNTTIRKNAHIKKSIIAENVEIGENVQTGIGDYAESQLDKKVYSSDLVTIGENSYVPANVKIGKNTAISGVTESSDYSNGVLESGGFIIKGGEDR